MILLLTTEETEKLIEKYKESRPKKIMERFDREDAGIMYVMKILVKAGKPMSAGELSEAMKVSTARVAVLIKKLEQNNLIVRSSDPSDARKTLVDVSDYGRSEYEKGKETFMKFCSAVIERAGVERFKEFIEISNEINDAVEAEFEIMLRNCKEAADVQNTEES